MSRKVRIGFRDGNSMKMCGDVDYELDFPARIVTVTLDGKRGFFNFDAMQYIYAEPESEED